MNNIERYQYKITIFTATYNRSYIIENLYNSLKRQTVKEFEWVVVDDGSTDETINLLRKWSRNDNCFPIRFVQTRNGGKHRAINIGTEMAKGELFFIVDSDDYLPDKAVETILKWYSDIENDTNFAGLGGLKSFPDLKLVGKTFNGESKDATSLERAKLKITGDKAEIFKTKILKKYKFPEINNEKFITESIIWNRIANDGLKLRWFNEVVYICEYLDDGLTKNSDEVFINNFEGYTLYVRETMNYYNLKNKYLLHIITAYIYRARKKGLKFSEIKNRTKLDIKLVILLYILGRAYKRIKK